MDPEDAASALGSLAQVNRLAIYRLLVKAGTDGLPAGEISRELGIPPSSLSFHLSQLTRSGMVTQERQSRNLIYRADFPAMNQLIDYLLEHCSCEPSCLDSAREKLTGVL